MSAATRQIARDLRALRRAAALTDADILDARGLLGASGSARAGEMAWEGA